MKIEEEETKERIKAQDQATEEMESKDQKFIKSTFERNIKEREEDIESLKEPQVVGLQRLKAQPQR